MFWTCAHCFNSCWCRRPWSAAEIRNQGILAVSRDKFSTWCIVRRGKRRGVYVVDANLVGRFLQPSDLLLQWSSQARDKPSAIKGVHEGLGVAWHLVVPVQRP